MKAEDEIQAAVLALKNRDLSTKEIYREVCSLLFFRHGITPTVTHLYRLVQKGSMGVPTAVLAQFWADLRERSKVDVAHPELPKELADVAAAAVVGIWKSATALSDSQLEVFRESAREQVEAAQTRVADLEAALAAMTAARDGAEALREKSERLREALAVEHEAERRAHAASMARGQELQRQAANLQSQIDSNQVAFSRDLTKAQQSVRDAGARAEAAERKALLEVDQERQARLKAEKLLDRIREQALVGQVQARDAALAQAEEIGSLKSKLVVADANGAALTRENEEARTCIQRLASELDVAVQRSTRLQAEADAIRLTVDRLAAAGSQTPRTPRSARR